MRGNKMLKYEEIAEKIERFIIEKNLPHSYKLQSFKDLMSEYNVSKSTIVKSLDLLEKKGIIYQIQGSGVFVRRAKRNGYINFSENQGFTSDLNHFDITSKIIKIEEISPPREVFENLNCTSNDTVYYVKRVRYINGQVLCLEKSYYKKDIVPYLNEEIARQSIFEYCKKALKLNISFSDKYIHVVKLDENESNLLELKEGDPALLVDEVFFLSSGTPFDFSKTVYHYINSQFFLQSNRIHS